MEFLPGTGQTLPFFRRRRIELEVICAWVGRHQGATGLTGDEIASVKRFSISVIRFKT